MVEIIPKALCASADPKDSAVQQATLDDHSEVVPPLPIPNRTVKHLSADDSGCTSVKVGHRQALIPQTPKCHQHLGVCLWAIALASFEYRFDIQLTNEYDGNDHQWSGQDHAW